MWQLSVVGCNKKRGNVKLTYPDFSLASWRLTDDTVTKGIVEWPSKHDPFLCNMPLLFVDGNLLNAAN